METRTNFLTGSFNDLQSAEKAYDKVRELGYSDEDISIIMSEDSMKKYFEENKHDEDHEARRVGTKAATGAGTGSVIGGAVGAAAGIIIALGTSVVVPGLGFIVAGPLATGLAGLGAGGVAGGIIGALIGAGIPKERAEKYEKGIREGNIIIGVQLRNEEDARRLEESWGHYGHNIFR
jgi:hypothetical protein